MRSPFDGFDWTDFWKDSDYARQEYQDEAPSDAQVAEIERRLGYMLPRSYVELARHQNGGIPLRTGHRTAERTAWALDHIAISGIYSIGSRKSCSLCGQFDTPFWIEEWGYPAIGLYFADCPSAGHDMVCLDYRECGPTGEPRVVHVDQEWDYKITPLAEDFEAFIRGLEPEDNFPLDV